MRKKKKGMTLIEVVIALGIISITLVPLANMLVTSVKANKKAEDIQTAKLLGQQTIEHIRAKNSINEDDKYQINGIEVEVGKEAEEIKDGVSKTYFPVTSTTKDGFSLEGKIYEENTRETINQMNDKLLGGFIVIKGDEIYYYKNKKTGGMTIDDFFAEGEGGRGNYSVLQFKKDEDVVIEFEKQKGNSSSESKITINNHPIGLDTDYDLGIYLMEASSLNFRFKIGEKHSQTDKVENVYIFKNASLSGNEGKLNILEKDNKIKIYENISYSDSTNGEVKKTGLYSIELDSKKDGKILENTIAQVYIGK